MTWSTDKIIALGLLATLVALIIVGGNNEAVNFLTGGLVGYLQRSLPGGGDKGGHQMTLAEEIELVKREHPRVWNYLLGVDDMAVTLPKFDENDEMFFSQKEKEERQNASGNSG